MITHHIVPCCNNGLHVEVTGKEGNDAIRNNLAVFDQNAPKISDHGRVVSDFESGADRNLVTPSSDDLHFRSARSALRSD
jgi:hypothetical protein